MAKKWTSPPTHENSTRKERLEYANEIYPVGTLYKSRGCTGTFTSIYPAKGVESDIEVGVGYVFYNNVWAEVVKEKHNTETKNLKQLADESFAEHLATVFPANSYVVLLNSPDGGSSDMPLETVYLLKEDASNHIFRVKKDIKGDFNGWYSDNGINLKMRAATRQEITNYKCYDFPCLAGESFYPEVGSGDIDNNIFKKGEYVVLLNSCSITSPWGEAIKVGYVYKLSEDSNTYNFMIETDLKSMSQNGWRTSYKIKSHSNLRLRAATRQEITNYKCYDFPCLAGESFYPEVGSGLIFGESGINWSEISPDKTSELVSSTDFKEGEYVVLLTTCNGDPTVWGKGLPVNHVYILAKDSHKFCFMVDKDLSGVPDIWEVNELFNYDSKLKLRAATPFEIAYYNLNCGPCSVEPCITPCLQMTQQELCSEIILPDTKSLFGAITLKPIDESTKEPLGLLPTKQVKIRKF